MEELEVSTFEFLASEIGPHDAVEQVLDWKDEVV